MTTEKAPSKKWTRDQLFVTLNVYHKMTFGQIYARQPVVFKLAERLGRGANSVAMKLLNFASLDPALKLRGIKGLERASALDRDVWDEFHDNLNETAPASEEALRVLFDASDGEDLEVLPRIGILKLKRAPRGPTEVLTTAKARRGQDYFRQSVINNSGGCCGVTGLAVRDLLVASHILPWGTHPKHRLNVRNGICLSRFHDAAFDLGLITFDDGLQLVLSRQLNIELPQRTVAENFGAYAGQVLHFPEDAVLPEPAFLGEHRKKIFEKRVARL